MNRNFQALARRFDTQPAPPVEPAKPTTVTADASPQAADTPNDNLSTTQNVVEPAVRRSRRILDAGEEAKLGKRKGRRIEGHLRGGRNSLDWGVPVESLGCMVPDGVNSKLKDLANGHKLHRWQVVDEAIRLFEQKYGPRFGSKPYK
jgi:hypothetical protein